MTTLILYSQFNVETRILRKAASERGWNTFRSEGGVIPEHLSGSTALYCPPPESFRLASQLKIKLIGCSAKWLTELPDNFLGRKLWLSSIKDLSDFEGEFFIKPALSKTFQAGIFEINEALTVLKNYPSDLKIIISTPVVFTSEYRCFISKTKVKTVSPYKVGNDIFNSYEKPLKSRPEDINDAIKFVDSVVKKVPCPQSFVLDVGQLNNGDWAVIEANESWAAAPYGCNLNDVLDTISQACIPVKDFRNEYINWDYEKHFYDSAPHLKSH